MESRIIQFDETPDPPEKATKPPFEEALRACAMNGTEFLEMDIPERRRLIGDWFREGDLGFIFAPRGVGKTWFAHLLIACLTAGRDLEDWGVPSPARVCLLDGEMPPGDVQARLRHLDVNGENLLVLSHQFLFDQTERSFQLSDAEQRSALLEYCVAEQVEVLVIDNLSSVSNISENDNDQWPAIGDWLLDFRRKGIAVIVVHHAGRNGQMRGGSRREDPAFWIIRLDDSKERTATEKGARFVTTFVKNRNAPQCPNPIDWHLTEDESGKFLIETFAADTATLVLQEIRGGLSGCEEISDALGVVKSTVSKAAKRLEANGQITIKDRKYHVT